MKYVSFDLETTGTDWTQDQVLEIAMLVEDTAIVQPLEFLPTFHAYVKHDRISGHPRALALHKRIFDIITTYPQPKDALILKSDQVGAAVKEFLGKQKWPTTPDPRDKDVGRIHLNGAGKNLAFDKLFLGTLNQFKLTGLRLQLGRYQFRARDLDPGPMLVNPLTDEACPGIEECCERLGVPQPEQEHTAVGDAWMVVQCLRKIFYNKTEDQYTLDWYRNQPRLFQGPPSRSTPTHEHD